MEAKVVSVFADSWKLSCFFTKSVFGCAIVFPLRPRIKQFPVFPMTMCPISSESLVANVSADKTPAILLSNP